MKITQTHNLDSANYHQYEGLSVVVETTEETLGFGISGGEPEDMTIGRDLSDVWRVLPMLVAAYKAGHDGDSLEIEKLEVDE